MAIELLEEVPDLDAILVCVSGGGMASGVAIVTNGALPWSQSKGGSTCET